MASSGSNSPPSTSRYSPFSTDDDDNKKYLVTNDLSLGEAAIPIPVYNSIDSLDLGHLQRMPSKFIYSSHNVYDEDEISEAKKMGCSCKKGQCTVENGCPCAKSTMGIELYEDRRVKRVSGLHCKFYDTLMVECSPECCTNCCRPSFEGEDGDAALCRQQRMTPAKFNLPLELHKMLVSGFGVRTREWIQSGTFIGEFVGELLCADEAPGRHRTEDYSYHVVCQHKSNSKGDHYVDPTNYGNITRFFNHSCLPNLVPIRFLSYHRDESRVSLGFVAFRDIPPRSELTIDYGSVWWQGKLRKFGGNFFCLCDSPLCMRPSPEKPQLSLPAGKLFVAELVKREHQAFFNWKKQQDMSRMEVTRSVATQAAANQHSVANYGEEKSEEETRSI